MEKSDAIHIVSCFMLLKLFFAYFDQYIDFSGKKIAVLKALTFDFVGVFAIEAMAKILRKKPSQAAFKNFYWFALESVESCLLVLLPAYCR